MMAFNSVVMLVLCWFGCVVVLGLRISVLLHHCVGWFAFGFPSYAGCGVVLVWLLTVANDW